MNTFILANARALGDSLDIGRAAARLYDYDFSLMADV
jgi:hypothetical protein